MKKLIIGNLKAETIVAINEKSYYLREKLRGERNGMSDKELNFLRSEYEFWCGKLIGLECAIEIIEERFKDE